MRRREFIKLTAVTGTSAALTACGNPEHELIRFVPDDDLLPGIAEWKPSVCPLCAAGCGVNVRVMDADFETTRKGQAGVVVIKAAKKLEGRPDHPINHGGLCPRGQAAIQVTYHPDRVASPMRRVGARGSGEFKPTSWDDAIGELVSKLDALAASGDQKSLAFVTRRRRTRRFELVAELLRRFGAPAPIAFDLFDEEVLRRSNEISFGIDQLPTCDLARSRYVLSFGADFLGTWNSPVAQTAAFGEMRQGRPGVRGTFVQLEPRMSLTGASADEWIATRPGTEGLLALSVAHVIMRDKLRPGAGASGGSAGRATLLIDGWSNGLPDYAPDKVADVTRVAARRIERLAHDAAALSPAVAIIGGCALAQTNGLFHAVAVNALNALLGAVGEPGGVFFTPRLAPLIDSSAGPVGRSQLRQLQQVTAKVLLIDGADPVYGSPSAWNVREKLNAVPFIASFSSFVDDTTALADLILPDHSFLESWVDSVPESGSLTAVANVAGPVMRPLYQTRATPDVLIEVAGKLKSAIALPWKTYDEALKASFDKLPSGAWDDVEKQGGWWGTTESGRAANPTGSVASASPAGRSPARTVQYAAPRFDGDAAAFPFHFLPVLSQAFLDGSTAHLPWLQELPDPLTAAMWSSWVEINPRTAATLHLSHGDIVEITSTHGSLRAPVILSPGTAPDVVAVPVGQGHRTFTRYASGRGVNPVAILAPVEESETGAFAWAATRVKLSRVSGSSESGEGRLIAFAAEMREHPEEVTR